MEKHSSNLLGITLFAVACAIYGISLLFAVTTGQGTILAEGMFPLSFVLYAGIGALIIARRRNLIGWIFYAMGISWPLRELAIAIAAYTVRVDPAAFRALTPITGVLINAWVVSFGLVPLLFILFPEGRLKSLGVKVVAILTVAAILNSLLTADPSFDSGSGTIAVPIPVTLLGIPVSPDLQDTLQGVSGTILMILYVVAAISLVVRLRRSRGVPREQFKWLAYAGLFFAFVVVLIFIPEYVDALAWMLQGAPYPAAMLWGIPFALALVSVPVAASIAIFKHRLYDIDVIIRRTLIYGVLTLLLALIYFGSVVFLQEALRALTGQTSDLAIVGSTLVIAALFAPLRNGIQRLIDRRLYRRKYDAALVLANFGTTARDEVDLNHLKAELLTVVNETMQPTSANLWLREMSRETKQ